MPIGYKAPMSIATRTEPERGFDLKIEKCRTLMGGTEAMRTAAKKYLPIFEGETTAHYNFRRALSYLFNGYRKTVWDFSAKVFEKPILLSDGTDPAIVEWIEDIDLEGRDLSIFGKQVFETGVQSGIEYLLVDAPPKVIGETVAQAMEMNNRPYIIHIAPEQVLGRRKSRINNRTVLSHFRYQEKVVVAKDEFKSETIEQIKTFDLTDAMTVLARTFQLDNTGNWIQVSDDIFTGMDEITVIPFYANRTDWFSGSPPLEDLADLNIAHWQSQSDQRNILHFARVPILFAKGLSEGSKLKISSGSATLASSPEADLKWVEHTGKAIASGQADLVHLEFQMQTMGLQFLTNTRGPQTATGEDRDDRKETSRLASMADNLKDALEKCLVWMAEYDGRVFDGEVIVHTDFRSGGITNQILTFLIQSVMHGKISKVTFWAEMKRHGLLGDHFDPEIEETQIEDEMSDVNGLEEGEGEVEVND